MRYASTGWRRFAALRDPDPARLGYRPADGPAGLRRVDSRSAGQRPLQVLPPHDPRGRARRVRTARSPPSVSIRFTRDVEAVEDLDPAALEEALARRWTAHAREAPAPPNASTTWESGRSKTRAVRCRLRPIPQARVALRHASREAARRVHRVASATGSTILALFEALRASSRGLGLGDLGRRKPGSGSCSRLRGLARPCARRILKVAYVQWTLYGQWDASHRQMRELGVELMGDVPFVVGGESADVWSHASQFQLHLSLGRRPTTSRPTARTGAAAVRLAGDGGRRSPRGSGCARATPPGMYDCFRHGPRGRLFPPVGPPRGRGATRGRFDPEGREGQQRAGVACSERCRTSSRAPASADRSPVRIAEDLGVIPPFVRDSLLRSPDAGLSRVGPEKDDDGPFRDPLAFPSAQRRVVEHARHRAHRTHGGLTFPSAIRERLAERASTAAGAAGRSRSDLALLGDLYRREVRPGPGPRAGAARD